MKGMNQLQKPMSQNTIDNLTDVLVDVMRYSNSSVIYPNLDKAESDDGVIAEWFYPIYNGTNDFSELTADEEVHKKLLSEELEEYSRKQEKLTEKLDDLGNE